MDPVILTRQTSGAAELRVTPPPLLCIRIVLCLCSSLQSTICTSFLAPAQRQAGVHCTRHSSSSVQIEQIPAPGDTRHRYTNISTHHTRCWWRHGESCIISTRRVYSIYQAKPASCAGRVPTPGAALQLSPRPTPAWQRTCRAMLHSTPLCSGIVTRY